MAQPKNCPFGVNTTIELKTLTNKSDSNSTIVISWCMFQLTSVPVLSDVFVICLRLIVGLTPNGLFLDCAIIAFSERYEEVVVKCSAYLFFFPPPSSTFSFVSYWRCFTSRTLFSSIAALSWSRSSDISKAPFLQITCHLVQLPYKKVRLLQSFLQRFCQNHWRDTEGCSSRFPNLKLSIGFLAFEINWKAGFIYQN
jgi:hypothetical protein